MKRKDMKRKIVAFMMISMVATGAMTACGTAADTANTTDTADTVQEVAEEVELEADTASADQKQSDEIYLNSYDNTEELDAKFPTQYPTATDGELENNIKNRLLTGFENWNRGYDAWEAWGNILYTDDSIYNVHGARLTLAEYQAAMDMMLGQVDIQMGDFKT